MRTRTIGAVAGLGGVAAMTAALRLVGVANATTISLSYLLVVLFVASLGEVATAVVTSVTAMLCFNFFFMPPVGTFTIADPQNWVALFAFLVVSVVASRLSTSARAKAQEALDRRRSRRGSSTCPGRHPRRPPTARECSAPLRGRVAPLRAGHGGHRRACRRRWVARRTRGRGGAGPGGVGSRSRVRLLNGSSGVRRTHAVVWRAPRDRLGAGPDTLAPVRVGARAVGLLATGGRALEAGTRDAIAGIVAIALERSEFLEERRGAELARQRAELSSALLASLSHDLRTPLTAIRTAVSNLDSDALPESQRRDQARVASGQLDRLTRLFDEILDMARIDSGTVQPQRAWVTPAEIVEAALAHASSALAGRDVRVDARDEVAVEIDPRLAASALAHLLENAAQYAPQGRIDVRGWTDEEGLRLEVRDEGPGVQPDEIERLFEPFYRGELLRHRVPGTGMGLAITRGLVAADRGRVWAENIAPRGACFTIAVPAQTRPIDSDAG